jgi:hypothetical protein
MCNLRGSAEHWKDNFIELQLRNMNIILLVSQNIVAIYKSGMHFTGIPENAYYENTTSYTNIYQQPCVDMIPLHVVRPCHYL